LLQSGPAGQTNLLARVPGRDTSKKSLLLLSHMDVVPVDTRAWSVEPFAGVIREGWIWGRGTLDMKGIGVQQMVALIALKQAGIVPARDVVIVSTADEETGGLLGAQWMIDKHWDKINAEYVLDEGGVVTADMLAPDRLVFGVTVGEKQNIWLRMRARGIAAHGSQPIPQNANLILLRAIERAMALPRSVKPDIVVEKMREHIGDMAENKFTAAIQGNTITLTTLESGVGNPKKVNVIPSAAEAGLDCRLLPGVNADEFVSEMKARINDPNVTIEPLSSPPDAGASESETALFRNIAAAARAYHPDAVITPILVPWSTDSVKFRQKGAIAYGVNPMVLDAKTMATMHSDEERIPVSEFLKGIRIFYEILRSDF
jgi:acetylornithine deacetylase/succinyl-diaminopimelate desuccinylase-like protein